MNAWMDVFRVEMYGCECMDVNAFSPFLPSARSLDVEPPFPVSYRAYHGLLYRNSLLSVQYMVIYVHCYLWHVRYIGLQPDQS